MNDSIFTFIEHGQRKFRISTGFDDGSIYKKGDKVIWMPNPKRVGVGPDGVYVSLDEVEIGATLITPLVVIMDEAIAHIEPVIMDNLDSEEQGIAIQDAHIRLEQTYPKSTPMRELWSSEAWAAKEAQATKMKKTFRRIDQNQ